MEKEVEDRLRFYSELRSSLFPYIYSAAHNAYETGMPVVRPLVLVYGDEKFDNVFNAYMLGDSLYVGAFDMNLTLPDGKWIDYFTGKVYEGNVSYEIPEGCGGALLVKRGSVFVTMTPQQYILEREHEYIINVYPGGDSSFELYEDDGFTFDYKDGGFATTRIALNDKNGGFELVVSERVGSFIGRADNGHNINQNSIPKIDGIKPVSDMKIKVFDTFVKEVTLAGEKLDFVRVEDGIELPLTAEMRKGGEVKIEFKY
jgi:alpha-glucosidase (family GH31 glycosyl hydrolase)